jgi:para-nitrobenzyl esterase
MSLVETTYGKVEGIEKRGVLQFRGIPFAAPPVGDLRFRPPAPPQPWDSPLVADGFRAMAPQQANPGLSALPSPERMETSEDCLYLNVFTAGTGGEPKPVMVWIHGGGFTGGSARDAWYNGTSFAREGVVVVTINYRLGALGFLHLGDRIPGSGNCGILDQVAALEWVRDNIAAFGGDPGNVTIFGESAGGMSVATVMGTPAAAGLFQRAIPQSGAAAHVLSADDAAEMADRVATAVGGVDALFTAPIEQILDAQARAMADAQREPGLRLGFSPVVDGTVLLEPPEQAVRDGLSKGVDLMTGTTRDEMTLFLAVAPAFADATEDDAVRRIDRVRPGTGRTLYDTYRSVLGPDAAPRDVWAAVETDRVFRIPAIRLAEAQLATTADVWMYLFTWESPMAGGMLGACHAIEIPFMWNTLSVRATDVFAGEGPDAQALADRMHGSWLSFARTGDPGWDRYDTEHRRTKVFGAADSMEDDPRAAARRVWDELG